ncbi:MAG: hypothetical protein KIS96_04295 [Bauldia sp.]|nr:hypothetical protein [Bauldia sp.]
MTATPASAQIRSDILPGLLPGLVAGVVFLVLVVAGAALLNDADTYWHVAVGRWIAENATLPTADIFSATAGGEHWIAKEWLSQLFYAGAYAIGGWPGVVVLAAAACAAAFGLLAHFLRRHLAVLPVVALVAVAFVLTAPHIVARPHVLALPVMVAFVGAIVAAADRGKAPSFWLLPLMVLWANLHAGFPFGILIAAGVALDAVVAAAPAERARLALRWGAFIVAALVAGCVTPYGAEPLLVTFRILALGDALSIIGEWQPQDFGSIGVFEVVLLGAIGLALLRGFRLSPVRILLLLGLLHLALSAVRNGELLGLVAPLVLAAPLARQVPALAGADGSRPVSAVISFAPAAVALVAGGLFAAMQGWTPSRMNTPAAALDAIEAAGAERILNDYAFGGYMIFRGVAPFVDGRTELYGTDFVMRHHEAVTLADLPALFALLDENGIEATLLNPRTPAVAYLDRDPGWRRLHADGIAVVHRRIAE